MAKKKKNKIKKKINATSNICHKSSYLNFSKLFIHQLQTKSGKYSRRNKMTKKKKKINATINICHKSSYLNLFKIIYSPITGQNRQNIDAEI